MSKRLTFISQNESSSNRAKQSYQEALVKGGNKHNLKYIACMIKRIKGKTSCISRHNLFVGKRFLEIVSRNFGPMHPWHKIFNRKLLKISYSCMPNMKSQIMSHNRKMLVDKAEEQKQCNCKDNCMVESNCLLTNVIYRATVIASEKNKQCDNQVYRL